MNILTGKHMNKILIKYCYIAFLVLSLNVYAVDIINITPKCADGSETPLCRCGDGFVQTNLGEECDLGKDSNGDVKNGKPGYGCDAECKVVKNDVTKDWTCNEVSETYSSDPALRPEKSEFNKLYLEMLSLYKEIKDFPTSIDCTADDISADDFNKCADQQRNTEIFISMNKHKPFLCDSINFSDKIDPKAYPTLTYVDVISKQEKTVDIEYEDKCGLGNLLLIPTQLKWGQHTNRDFETEYGCTMNFIKTVGGLFVRHEGWVMSFLSETYNAGGKTVAQLIKEVNNTQANLNNLTSDQKRLMNDIIYCVQKIPHDDPRAKNNCEDPNLCYDILAKAIDPANPSPAVVLKKFNNNFNFAKANTPSGVATFPQAMNIGGVPDPQNSSEAKKAEEVWDNPADKHGVGYFTIYPEGSTFPWFRDL
jgi:hypothetical protein